jgi:hypothetical protein
MTDRDRGSDKPRLNTALLVVIGLMVLVVAGGLAYSLTFPEVTASNPPQTTGSAASHARSGQPM